MKLKAQYPPNTAVMHEYTNSLISLRLCNKDYMALNSPLHSIFAFWTLSYTIYEFKKVKDHEDQMVYTSVATSRGECLNSMESGINLKSRAFDDCINSSPSHSL